MARPAVAVNTRFENGTHSAPLGAAVVSQGRKPLVSAACAGGEPPSGALVQRPCSHRGLTPPAKDSRPFGALSGLLTRPSNSAPSSTRWGAFTLLLSISLSLHLTTATAQSPATAPAGKQASAFYPARLIEQARENARRHEWAARIQNPIVEAAEPFLRMSDEQLWQLMFGNTIKRSWMVWSNGHCPACEQPVPMYNWEVDAIRRPWKMRCPHCRELFPKNDFEEFYRSGLDEHNVFQPAKADRSLLFNVEHPDPADPLHTFGVDDGEGYVKDGKRWRFIGAYLIYGQWKQAIIGGASKLAAAYVVTGEKAYAHKAGVLLDRVADLYPTFDFKKEGILYEGPASAGYVSTWHDACGEVRSLAIAYDQVFEAIREDRELVAFLSQKAKQYKLENPKASFADIQRNIEDRILRDTLANRPKIESNYPQTDMTIALLKTVLAWPENRAEVLTLIDTMLHQATAVDGLSGEKGLAGYARIAPHSVASLLGCYARVEPDFLKEALQRQPRLHAMYRFHLDTWCLGRYYPRIGDAGVCGQASTVYEGASFSKNPGLNPSSFTLLMNLYELTGDTDLVRALYQANGSTVEGLPYDLFAANPAGFQERVRQVIREHGEKIELSSINKPQWALAILRSGRGGDARAVWLDYDSGGRHGHADALNIGLFAQGLDLLPDFGYPPVNHGGWGAPRAVWYTSTAAHNTVLVDNANLPAGRGRCTLWCDGREFRAVRASAPALIRGRQYERTLIMVDISPRDFYVLDVFRVIGGSSHVKLTHGPFGTISSQGLSLQKTDERPVSGAHVQMRDFRRDSSPSSPWSVDFKVEDYHKLLPAGSEVHLRLTDLTSGVEVYTAESWVSTGGFTSLEEAWTPSVCVRRQGGVAPLASTFVSVIEPYRKAPNLRQIRRLSLETQAGVAWPESHVAVEITLADGRRDLLIVADAEAALGKHPQTRPAHQHDAGAAGVSGPSDEVKPSRAAVDIFVQKETGLRLEGELCLVRLDASGRPERVAACRAAGVGFADSELKFKAGAEFVERPWK
ncbi:MAG TPA: heparinase II/III family protein [Phycisphaerae bacterium]|nr:heparinase II/III family protein [Phycisphaerae bacterium]HPP20575.1 heparinase II/III family protein [Phycisphaerae bacterium]HPU33994.1 heparinase II/III family protein [Phycisphaerae bacterium]HQA43969.1 heparinase II/III family protein [Phycisphaerae bacterium]HQE44389.1 heparinase II/III family protein [Phycisphaerae bacterium]